VIGDPSHHGRRRDITQKMNNEDLDSDGGGANVGAHRIHDRGIQWRGIQQQEESRNRNRRTITRPLKNRAQSSPERRGPCRRPTPGSRRFSFAAANSRPAIRPPGTLQSIDHDDDAENEIRVGERVMALAVKKLRHPHLNPPSENVMAAIRESPSRTPGCTKPGIDALQIQVRRRVKPCQETASKNSRR